VRWGHAWLELRFWGLGLGIGSALALAGSPVQAPWQVVIFSSGIVVLLVAAPGFFALAGTFHGTQMTSARFARVYVLVFLWVTLCLAFAVWPRT
jgi:hypothetical protein